MSDVTKLVLNRNYVLATTMGHVIAFQKDVPTAVPPAAFAAAIAIGALPADGSSPDLLVDAPVSDEPMDPAIRNPLILEAITKIIARNSREDFAASGAPKYEAVSKEVGFSVSRKEVAAQLQEYHDRKAS